MYWRKTSHAVQTVQCSTRWINTRISRVFVSECFFVVFRFVFRWRVIIVSSTTPRVKLSNGMQYVSRWQISLQIENENANERARRDFVCKVFRLYNAYACLLMHCIYYTIRITCVYDLRFWPRDRRTSGRRIRP